MLVFSDSQSLEIFCRKAFLCAFEGLPYNGKLESPFPMGALSGCSISCVPCAQFRAKPRRPYLSLELGPTSRAPRGFREQERCQKWISGFFCLFPFQSLMGRGWRGLVPTHANTNKHICKVTVYVSPELKSLILFVCSKLASGTITVSSRAKHLNLIYPPFFTNSANSTAVYMSLVAQICKR